MILTVVFSCAFVLQAAVAFRKTLDSFDRFIEVAV